MTDRIDIYQKVADVLGVPRDEAKKRVLMHGYGVPLPMAAAKVLDDHIDEIRARLATTVATTTAAPAKDQ